MIKRTRAFDDLPSKLSEVLRLFLTSDSRLQQSYCFPCARYVSWSCDESDRLISKSQTSGSARPTHLSSVGTCSLLAIENDAHHAVCLSPQSPHKPQMSNSG
jgi:hypothetical protein